eukprot:365424-Chlamydomonas_euryale.AAC.36
MGAAGARVAAVPRCAAISSGPQRPKCSAISCSGKGRSVGAAIGPWPGPISAARAAPSDSGLSRHEVGGWAPVEGGASALGRPARCGGVYKRRIMPPTTKWESAPPSQLKPNGVSGWCVHHEAFEQRTLSYGEAASQLHTVKTTGWPCCV